MQLLWGNCYNSTWKLSLFLASNIVFCFLEVTSVYCVPKLHTPPDSLRYLEYNSHIHFVNGISSCVMCHYSLGLGFCVRVRFIVSVMGSVSYLNENFVVFSICGIVYWVPWVAPCSSWLHCMHWSLFLVWPTNPTNSNPNRNTNTDILG